MKTQEEIRKERNAYMRQWNRNNSDKVKATKRKKYLKNRDKYLATMKRYRESHPPDKEYHHNYYLKNMDVIKKRAIKHREDNIEEIRIKRALFRKNNRQKFKEKGKKYYQKNKDILLEKAKVYSAKNSKKIVKRVLEYNKRNPEKLSVWRKNTKANRKLRVNGKKIQFTPEQLYARLSMYGNKCWICGKDADEVDHVIPLYRGGWHTLSNLRPACITCNRKKHTKNHNEIAHLKKVI